MSVDAPSLCPLNGLPAHHEESGLLLVVIETIRGSGNKFKFDPYRGVIGLNRVLPAGSVFPYDFGFVPSTSGADGDPLDVLLIMDEPTFPGCIIESRLIGVIEARQKEKHGTQKRNDRLVAVVGADKARSHIKTLKDLGESAVAEIEHFFIRYNRTF